MTRRDAIDRCGNVVAHFVATLAVQSPVGSPDAIREFEAFRTELLMRLDNVMDELQRGPDAEDVN